MKLRQIYFLFVVLLSCSISVFGKSDKLAPVDVKKIMEQLFEYHVDIKEINQKVLSRSLAVYVNQFDSQGIYFAEHEVLPFLNPSKQTLEFMEKEFLNQRYTTYYALNKEIEKTIYRARQWRASWSKNPEKLVKEALESKGTLEEGYLYQISDLEKKHRTFFLQYIHYQAEKLPHVVKKHRYKQLVDLCEKQIAFSENQYLGFDENEKMVTQKTLDHCVILKTMKSLAKALDDHTAYYSPEEAHAMKVQLEKGMHGIGVVLHEDIEGVAIADVIEQGPAGKYGLLYKGDRIVQVDDKSVVGLSFSKVLNLLRGDEGSMVKLGVIREKQGQEVFYQVEIRREKIELQDKRVDFDYESYDDGIIGKLTLHSFYESGEAISSEKDLRNALSQLKKKGKVKGIVLDMRENSGGFLSQAIRVCSLFMNNGVVVASKYGDGSVRYYRSIDGSPSYQGPLVLLVSKGSASATEIVAQCLQDYGIALVVGDEHTYGKGTIQYQTITSDRSSSFFKVTVGRYYTVSGKSTQIEGVIADVVVPSFLAYEKVGERFLDYPLEQDYIPAVYQDSLEDLDPIARKWFEKYYLPNLQKHVSQYDPYREELRRKSQARIAKNQRYQHFLSSWKNHENPRVEEDLQMEEAVQILKDYLNLSQGQFQ